MTRPWAALIAAVALLGCSKSSEQTPPPPSEPRDSFAPSYFQVSGINFGVVSVTSDGEKASVLFYPDDSLRVIKGTLLNEGLVQIHTKRGNYTRISWTKDEVDCKDDFQPDFGDPFSCSVRRISPDAFRERTYRPQVPSPPLPYVEVEGSLKSGDYWIGYTMTLPIEGDSHPGLVLLSGSGSDNRDYTHDRHPLFLLFADHLARHGIASIRLDDPEGEAFKKYDFRARMETAIEAAKLLGEMIEVDAHRVGVLGHSEGGVVAALAAANEPSLAYAVLLAAPIRGAGENLAYQWANNVGWELSKEELETTLAPLFALDLEETDIHRPLAERRKLIDQYIAPLRAKANKTLPPKRKKFVNAVFELEKDFLSDNRNGWARPENVRITALQALDHVIPQRSVLGMYPQGDKRVAPKLNADALNASGAKTVEVLPGLNHVFRPIEPTGEEKYLTVAPIVLTKLSDWVLTEAARIPAQGTRSPSTEN